MADVSLLDCRRVDLQARVGFVLVAVPDIDAVLDIGALPPAVAKRHGLAQLQRLDPDDVLMSTRLAVPGRPSVAGLVHARHMTRNPLTNRIATGYGTTLRQNSDIVLVGTSPARLDRVGVSYLLASGNALSPSTLLGLRADAVPLDEAVLRSGDFKGARGLSFDAGLFIPDRLPPKGFGAIVCAFAATAERVLAAVAAAGLDVPVAVDRSMFGWPPAQRREA